MRWRDWGLMQRAMGALVGRVVTRGGGFWNWVWSFPVFPLFLWLGGRGRGKGGGGKHGVGRALLTPLHRSLSQQDPHIRET